MTTPNSSRCRCKAGGRGDTPSHSCHFISCSRSFFLIPRNSFLHVRATWAVVTHHPSEILPSRPPSCLPAGGHGREQVSASATNPLPTCLPPLPYSCVPSLGTPLSCTGRAAGCDGPSLGTSFCQWTQSPTLPVNLDFNDPVSSPSEPALQLQYGLFTVVPDRCGRQQDGHVPPFDLVMGHIPVTISDDKSFHTTSLGTIQATLHLLLSLGTVTACPSESSPSLSLGTFRPDHPSELHPSEPALAPRRPPAPGCPRSLLAARGGPSRSGEGG
jgi:hypothetical protein